MRGPLQAQQQPQSLPQLLLQPQLLQPQPPQLLPQPQLPPQPLLQPPKRMMIRMMSQRVLLLLQELQNIVRFLSPHMKRQVSAALCGTGGTAV